MKDDLVKRINEALSQGFSFEAFTLIQLLTYVLDKDLYNELQAARRKFIEILVDPNAPAVKPVHMIPRKLVRSMRYDWTKWQITPEISYDMRLTGKRIPKSVAIRLEQVHKRQIQLITGHLVLGRGRRA